MTPGKGRSPKKVLLFYDSATESTSTHFGDPDRYTRAQEKESHADGLTAHLPHFTAALRPCSVPRASQTPTLIPLPPTVSKHPRYQTEGVILMEPF